MADKNNRSSDNAPGPWYVDNSCIGCRQCGEYVPGIFKPSADDHHYVFHQPNTAEELTAAEEALQGCPVDAIGNDDY